MKKRVNRLVDGRIEISTVIIIATIILGFLSIAGQITLKNVVVDIFENKSDWVVKTLKTDDNLVAPETVDIDWKKEYPFSDEPGYEQVDITFSDDNDGNSSEKKEGKLEKVYNMLDKYSSKYFTFVDECKVLSKGFGKSLGMNLISDSSGNLVFFQPDGWMMAEKPYKSVDEEISNINNFAAWLQENDIDYFYVNVPSPVDPEEEEIIIAEGYDEHSNQMADELLGGLEKAGTKYLDIREFMKEHEISYTDSFFQYDHHMLPSSGLWVAEEISKKINKYENRVTDFNVFSKENYDIITSEEKALGGYGVFATSVYVEKVPIDLYYPKFSTCFRKIVPTYGIDITGDFGEVMYSMWNYPCYDTYNHGLQPLKKYYNNSDNVDDINILLLTDSYSMVISPFLACAYSNIDEIDLRGFDGSLETVIQENDYDMVISIYSQYCINNNTWAKMFEFR